MALQQGWPQSVPTTRISRIHHSDLTVVEEWSQLTARELAEQGFEIVQIIPWTEGRHYHDYSENWNGAGQAAYGWGYGYGYGYTSGILMLSKRADNSSTESIAPLTVEIADQLSGSLGPSFRITGAKAFSDEHIRMLDGMTRVKSLGLKTTDAGLARLRGLTELRTLELTGSRITDQGVAHLAYLPAIRKLSLQGVSISDKAVTHMESMKHLEELNISKTDISDEGFERLQQSLPDCRIVR
jgi:hypothetical protein